MGQRSNFQQGPMKMKFDMDDPLRQSKYVKILFQVIQGH